MYVRECMIENIPTVTVQTSLLDAQKVMQEHGIDYLLVVTDEKLEGLFTKDELDEVASSPPASDSAWQLKYILSYRRVGEIMRKQIVTITPDTTVEEVHSLAKQHDLKILPVVERGKLVGAVNTSDLPGGS